MRYAQVIMFLPKTFENYRITEKIGTGRYGTCYEAYDANGRKVVIKRFKEKKHRKNIYSHATEAVMLSVIDDPAVPHLLGIINSPSGYFFVMEYKEGLSLNQWLFHKHYHYNKKDILRIGSQLLDILIYIHSRNIIHGDLSIYNVLDSGNQVSLIDFGLSGYVGSNGLTFQLDFACFANILLYLLYSNTKAPAKIPWYDALPLNDLQKQYLWKLLAVKGNFSDTPTAKREFIQSFA